MKEKGYISKFKMAPPAEKPQEVLAAPVSKKGNINLNLNFSFLQRIKEKDVVMLSRQLATLFGAKISVLRGFVLLSEEMDNVKLKKVLDTIVSDLESGNTLSQALSRHEIFSDFFVNMVASGEESGNLSQTFEYLADYLERNFELASKARSALIYPAFVISTFIGVMILMLTYIIPKIGVILTSSGQDLPAYTKLVLGASAFLTNYGLYILLGIILFVGGVMYYLRDPKSRRAISDWALNMPYVGDLYKKLYISQISDNMQTMLSSGIPIIKALQTTRDVVSNRTYKSILEVTIDEVGAGRTLSNSFADYPDYIPSIITQMLKVGEESGKTVEILETLSQFYKREVTSAVDTLVSLIEPAMIVLLGLGVGTLLASVLIPIYNVSMGV